MAALLALAWPAAAQTLERMRLDAAFDALAQHDQARGSIAIAVPGQPLHTRAVGRANEQVAQAAPETRYRIGSVSKVFTAVLVMQLVDEGKLTLDTPLAKFFPAFPNAERVTVAYLLAHRSGLGDAKDLPDFDRWAQQARSLNDLRVALQGMRPNFEPGARMQYNNSGYILLWWIVERVTGLPYADALRQRITAPLGLAHTSYSPDPDREPDGSAWYRWNDDPGTPPGWTPMAPTHPSVPGGAGAVLSTPRDLVVFLQVLFDGKLVSTKSLERMNTIVEGAPSSTSW